MKEDVFVHDTTQRTILHARTAANDRRPTDGGGGTDDDGARSRSERTLAAQRSPARSGREPSAAANAADEEDDAPPLAAPPLGGGVVRPRFEGGGCDAGAGAGASGCGGSTRLRQCLICPSSSADEPPHLSPARPARAFPKHPPRQQRRTSTTSIPFIQLRGGTPQQTRDASSPYLIHRGKRFCQFPMEFVGLLQGRTWLLHPSDGCLKLFPPQRERYFAQLSDGH